MFVSSTTPFEIPFKITKKYLRLGRIWKDSGNGKRTTDISKPRVFDGGPPGNDRQVLGF